MANNGKDYTKGTPLSLEEAKLTYSLKRHTHKTSMYF